MAKPITKAERVAIFHIARKLLREEYRRQFNALAKQQVERDRALVKEIMSTPPVKWQSYEAQKARGIIRPDEGSFIVTQGNIAQVFRAAVKQLESASKAEIMPMKNGLMGYLEGIKVYKPGQPLLNNKKKKKNGNK